MEKRQLGSTGLRVSVVGFGCGSVGGLMTRGTAGDQERAVALALDHGVNYFDTAAQYGEGKSETNLGRVLARLQPDVVVATKVKVPAVERQGIGAAIVASLDESLRRLGRDHIDLLQLHNTVAAQREPGGLGDAEVIEQVIPALERLVSTGKIRFFGMTALGETAALGRLVDTGAFVTAQVALNLLNPSPARVLEAGYPAQDYDRLLARMARVGMGGVAIRVLAAGALAGGPPHPLARGDATPMGSGSSFEADAARAVRFQTLVEQGYAKSLASAAFRYALGSEGIATVLVGVSGPEQIEEAVQAAAAGSLSADAMQAVAEIQSGFVGMLR